MAFVFIALNPFIKFCVQWNLDARWRFSRRKLMLHRLTAIQPSTHNQPPASVNCPHLSLDDGNSANGVWLTAEPVLARPRPFLAWPGLAVVLPSVWCDMKNRLTTFKSLKTKSFAVSVSLKPLVGRFVETTKANYVDDQHHFPLYWITPKRSKYRGRWLWWAWVGCTRRK